jgi:predicted 3-demethylubiquinone-9 3-methyltransferase (glyoxalase superfamily)
MSRITPFLWFDKNAQEAVEFYLTVFADSKRMRQLDSEPGSTMTIGFELDGQEFVALNGGPHFAFTPAISFVVNCDTQDEVDYYWDRLIEGGAPSQCGWLTDQFGLSWQIVPRCLPDYLMGPDPQGAQRAMQAMMTMVKLSIPELEAAYLDSASVDGRGERDAARGSEPGREA